MGTSDDFAYPEPPLPEELQKEVEASVERFRAMFPAFVRSMADDYVPQYRAEITSLLRKAYTSALNKASFRPVHP